MKNAFPNLRNYLIRGKSSSQWLRLWGQVQNRVQISFSGLKSRQEALNG